MRYDLIQQIVTRLITEDEFRQRFFDNPFNTLAAYALDDEEHTYMLQYTPEALHLFVGTLTAHLVVPIHASRRFTIVPAHAPLPADRIGIRLTPGIVFGNGIHPSTMLSLAALEATVQRGDSVLDIGTGTGILAIAAAKLGAVRVLGVDVLADAITEATLNLDLNAVQHIVRVEHGSLNRALRPTDGAPFRAQVVVANVLPNVLLKLINQGIFDALHPNGTLILSGMRDTETAPVEAALAHHNVTMTRHTYNEWVCFRIRRLSRHWYEFWKR